MRQELPEAFEKRMRDMLGEEFDAYMSSYQDTRQYGLRVNPLKISGEELERYTSFHLSPIPWTQDGYFYSEEDQPARHPYYTAGLYYLQEPSAMTPASRLSVTPGERVLDLCAAPGGKATALGAALQGKGVLVANDISNSRAKALLKNLELFGIPNAFVTNEIPGKLAESFEGFFDKVLVDAPCSGEGMFRKDPAVIKTWDKERPEYFARLQKDILKNAVKMLRPGGELLYSTCTFAPVENEGSISWLLEEYPEMKLQPIEAYEGFAPGCPEWGNGDPSLAQCVRIWPHRMNGEGHFLALLKKEGGFEDGEITDGKNGKDDEGTLTGKNGRDREREKTLAGKYERNEWKKAAGKPGRNDRKTAAGKSGRIDKKSRQVLEEFFADCAWKPDWERTEIRGDKVYQVPELPENLQGIHFLRNGLYMGEMKKDRFEPSQQLAMTLNASQYAGVISLKPGDERVEKYLRGETILVENGESKKQKGWILVCVDNFSLGWGKLVNGVLKNKYWGGWRKN